MKKTQPLSEQPTQQLLIQRKKLTAALTGLGIFMVLACAFLLYYAITAKQPAMLAVVFGCTMSFVPLLISLGQLNKEIKTRTDAGN
ncbi:MAG: hypothetical protein EOO09_14165 [Chitinophagaceae bacterium]|nr:MAG: hypothetical protein EOO09_14165 [Chitinophagaceae bacterium]